MLDELSTKEQFICRKNIGNLTRGQAQGNFKKVKICSKTPISFNRTEAERDLELNIAYPAEFTYSNTVATDERVLRPCEIKDIKAEEKRIYELENCKISAIAELGNEGKGGEGDQIQYPVENQNKFNEGNEMLNVLNIFEIGNNQMF